MSREIKFIAIIILLLSAPLIVSADYLGQRTEFYIDSDYDYKKRDLIVATLQEITSKIYFYIDEDWWESLNYDNKGAIKQLLRYLDGEFRKKIYPTLTSIYGEEWNPGIDNDAHITVLIHPMKEKAGGYFNSADEYFKIQAPNSNQREMIYLNSLRITEPIAESFLAHEFMHLITFNQKEKKQGVTDEIWLNEARSEYTSTLLGYDDNYLGSNLQRRVKNFLDNPSDSLTEWNNQEADYGVLNIFTQYLVEHYGIEILVDSLHSSEVGIPSLNFALKKNGFEKDFSQVFIDWMIAVLINNCSSGETYCYKNKYLENLRISPSLNYLPFGEKSSLSVTHSTKNWAGNWLKVIGGIGNLKIEFIGDLKNLFKVPYLTQDFEGKYSLKFFILDRFQKGEILVPEFGKKFISVIILPSIQTKTIGFNREEPSSEFSFIASILKNNPEQQEELIKELLIKIDILKAEIIRLQAKIEAILAKQKISCQKLENNLYFGMENSEVRCLQEFLKSQGQEIYPEGLITGKFLSLTQRAVIRFQEKYSQDILASLDLKQGTGFVGEKTRDKINEILKK